MSKSKYAISDALWEKIQGFIPPRTNTHPRGGGRKPKDDRLVFESMLFVLRFGCQWDTLNATGLCPSSTVHDRFQKWRRAEMFHRMRDSGLLEEEVLRDIDWSWLADDNARPGDAAAPSRFKPIGSWQDSARKRLASGRRERHPGTGAKRMK